MSPQMYWANFLHMYQPAQQQPDILEMIVLQSYRPMLAGLIAHPQVRLTINVNGSLLELFDRHGHHDILDMLRVLGESKQVEFTGSAKYHALLPFLNDQEVTRQIELNNESLAFFLGKHNMPRGFFPTEMAYDKKLLPMITSLGFEWIIMDEIACGVEVGNVNHQTIYEVETTNLKVFFRNRRLSNAIMSAAIRSQATFTEAAADHLQHGDYVVTAMDFETFGHHRPGLEQSIFDVFATTGVSLVQISDLTKLYPARQLVTPISATWATSKLDITNGTQFLSWSDPENPIHTLQWTLTDLVLQAVCDSDHTFPQYKVTRTKMDIALASDHFWWASAKPWWSLPMIEDGAFRLLSTLESIAGVDPKLLVKGKALYQAIVATAFDWQRSGKIHQLMSEQGALVRIPFQDRDDENIFPVFVEMMEKLEKAATQRKEYEKAILWRDAIHKLKQKLDIYDALNAIELLKVEIPHQELTAAIEKYKVRYHTIRGGQPEQRGA